MQIAFLGTRSEGFPGSQLCTANVPFPPASWIGSKLPTSHIIKINVPGFAKDAIKVQIEDGNLLHVRAEGGAKEDGESGPMKEEVWHVSERRVSGRDFSRSVELPENVKADQVKAQVQNGVLTIVIPKDNSANAKASRIRNVNITSKL